MSPIEAGQLFDRVKKLLSEGNHLKATMEYRTALETIKSNINRTDDDRRLFINIVLEIEKARRCSSLSIETIKLRYCPGRNETSCLLEDVRYKLYVSCVSSTS